MVEIAPRDPSTIHFPPKLQWQLNAAGRKTSRRLDRWPECSNKKSLLFGIPGRSNWLILRVKRRTQCSHVGSRTYSLKIDKLCRPKLLLADENEKCFFQKGFQVLIDSNCGWPEFLFLENILTVHYSVPPAPNIPCLLNIFTPSRYDRYVENPGNRSDKLIWHASKTTHKNRGCRWSISVGRLFAVQRFSPVDLQLFDGDDDNLRKKNLLIATINAV